VSASSLRRGCFRPNPILRFPLVHADECPQFANASFDFAISDAGRLSGAIPIDGSKKWRGSSDLAVHATRVPASASGRRTQAANRPPGSSTRERLGGRAWFSWLTNGPSSRLRRNTTSFSRGALSKSTRTATAQRSASSSIRSPSPAP
jgi:hypothetical protein